MCFEWTAGVGELGSMMISNNWTALVILVSTTLVVPALYELHLSSHRPGGILNTDMETKLSPTEVLVGTSQDHSGNLSLQLLRKVCSGVLALIFSPFDAIFALWCKLITPNSPPITSDAGDIQTPYGHSKTRTQVARKVDLKSTASLPSTMFRTRNDSNAETTFGGLFRDLAKLKYKDAKTLLTLFVSKQKGVQNDSQLLLENMIQLLGKLDPSEKMSRHMTGDFVNTLWGERQHPCLSTLDGKYRYRTADGSDNNVLMPDLGKAGNAYTRSAKSTIFQNIALPNPGDIFDSLMARDAEFEPHPNGISSMLFNFATLITHDLFRTDHKDFNKSQTSSYLDLSPLYGNNEAEQTNVRTLEDGLLKPDCFSEKRLLGFPPAVGVTVIMFNRFHNYVATSLAAINENGRFTRPGDDSDIEAWVKYDEDLFQTSRLITCGLYINCVLKDYVRTILSLNRVDSKWDLDPRFSDSKIKLNTPEGVGNQVAAEFNLVYRWHSAISEKDTTWTENRFAQLFQGKKPEDVTLTELLMTLGRMEHMIPNDPLERPFADLKRDASTMRFSDDDLVEILQSSISDVAGSFGANRIPKAMRGIEILGIIQSRKWEVATLNEFRTFVGLTRHETFEDINPDPEVAQKLKNLYDHPDLVELYPGLVSEKAKPAMSPGSGLCVNFTTSYAILSDAVSLVRGDRFYTIDYTPRNLTNWGYDEANYDRNVDDGCVFHKLILRAFPNHFASNSIYAHYPFVTPQENMIIMTSLARSHKYDWELPSRKSDVVLVKDYATFRKISGDRSEFKTAQDDAFKFLTPNPEIHDNKEVCACEPNADDTKARKLYFNAAMTQEWKIQVRQFYGSTALALLELYSRKMSGRDGTQQVDIIRDVATLVSTRFAAALFDLPIKNAGNASAVYTEQELKHVFETTFNSTFPAGDFTNNFKHKEAAQEGAQQLRKQMITLVKSAATTEFIGSWFHSRHPRCALKDFGAQLIRQLLKTGLQHEEIVSTYILPLLATVAVEQARTFGQCLDYYLEAGREYLPEMYKLTRIDTEEADEKIMRYFNEGVRLGAIGSLYRDYRPAQADKSITIFDGTSSRTIFPGSRVNLDFRAASYDPLGYPDPEEVKLDRPLDSYLPYDIGFEECLGKPARIAAIVAMCRVVFGLKNLRRAQSDGNGVWYGENQGEMKKVVGTDGITVYMTPDQANFSSIPTSMKVQWDEENENGED